MTRAFIKALLKPSAYPEPTSRVSVIQTHVSFIFLTDHFAYKIKKPVDFGFLNFSTIDRRRFYCNEEVRLNRRLCPDIYLGVVELHQNSDGIAFHGFGPTIEYAVKMKRLPHDRMLDRLIDRNEITPDHIRAVAQTIARFHRDTPTSPSVAEYGSIDRIRYNWQENFSQMVPYPEVLSDKNRELLQAFVNDYLDNNEDRFTERIKNGFIRECDGDIHLENICIDNNAVYIFDCIEFNDRFRCCDTAADLAFLLMDLDYHKRHDLASVAYDEYIAASSDTSAGDVMLFYQLYRAFVRGKVDSFQLHDQEIDDLQKNTAKTRACRYFRLARGYRERMRLPQTLFLTCGLIGSGKSTVAEALSFELGITICSSDRIRKQLHGFTANDRVDVPYGCGIYQQQFTDNTYQWLLDWADDKLSAGKSVIIDASFINQEKRLLFKAMADRHAVRCVILFLDCNPAELKNRLHQRRASGDTVSDGRPELLCDQTAAFIKPDNEGIVVHLDSSMSLDVILDTIYQQVSPC